MSRNSVHQKLSIFEYTDFRAYLRDLCHFLKTSQRSFSFRLFSRAAGFSSPNFLKLVMDGKRNLSSESIEKFAKAFKLNKEEADFFRTLVHFNQAKTHTEKTHFAEKLLESRPYRALHPLKPAQYAYYSTWYLVPVRELIDTRGFREDPEWIARQLDPPITVSEARKALETLQALGMIGRNKEGRLIQKDAVLTTDDEVASASVAQFHREMIKKASESIDRFSGELREISSVTMSLSETGFRQAKEIVQRMRKDLLELAGRDMAQNAVYQFNFQLFPVSQKQKEEGGS
jgi:uncharacterized protein (TIGR02147 family)